MNTVKSFWLGWGSLCVAGGGAYYFAKKSINADRAARFEESQRKKRMVDSLEYSNNVPSRPMSASAMGGSIGSSASGNGGNGTPARDDTAGSPSQEASYDPAPTRHAPATEGQRVVEKSKYESNQPFRSPKGDRFS
ncbi:Uu.00g093080.m01.CDS01 [Anthostomella pinea]|uniref:Uu.00g093080.m01.CDS01 n=1 Tax=Anthostomella pinea TaxID=933095 RepID=A0AAI8VP27_9PEZI|nr:Uu.00g093080.m01.CDS01 [Anthostomella pinea]